MKPSLSLAVILAATGSRLEAQPASAPHYLGVSSCTAAACHGSLRRDDQPAWHSAYTVWSTQDPHSDAGVTLLSDRSRQIVRLLRGAETSGDDHRRFLRERCTGCHATPSQRSLTQGVSCEACHGPAGGWLEPHTRTSWTTLTPLEKLSQHGMANTVDLSQRASLCTRCHVGPAQVDGRLHDVNHDLIAAGHPRLAFEFSSYLAQMPAHWDTARDRARTANFDMQSWTAGQFASARAALELRGTRANQSEHAGNPSAIWPEFAEFECAACHHALRPRDAARKESGSKGRIVWGMWNYFPLVSGLQFDRVLAAIEEPTVKANSPTSNPKAASTLSTLGLVELDALQEQIKLNPPDARTILAKMSADSRDWNWEQATQWYLAAAALSGSYANGNSNLQQKLAAFRTCLEQPQPYEFNPDHPQFRKALEDLLKQLP